MMFYLWPKYTAVVGKSVAEFMKRAGAGDTPKETLKDLPQRLLVRCFQSRILLFTRSRSVLPEGMRTCLVLTEANRIVS